MVSKSLTYTGEPCRICGKVLTEEDTQTSVFCGYSKDGKNRSAHEECYKRLPPPAFETPHPDWVHQ